MNIVSINDQPAPAQKPTYKPYGNVLILDYVPPEMDQQIHLPKGAKPIFDFITCGVVAAGPAVEIAKPGTRILIATKAIMLVLHDGVKIAVTQENTILAVVE